MKESTKILIGNAIRTHGMSGTRIYRIWSGIHTRCYNKNEKIYPYYGGRGIGMCDRWRDSFESFYEDVGDPPSELYSMDRYPDQDGNYEPGNVRWATDEQQGRNKRNNIYFEHNDQVKTVGEWAEITGLSYGTVWSRIKRGLSSNEVLAINRKSLMERRAPVAIRLYREGHSLRCICIRMGCKPKCTSTFSNLFRKYSVEISAKGAGRAYCGCDPAAVSGVDKV